MKRQWWLIHALEPLNCVAHVQGDKVEIWTLAHVVEVSYLKDKSIRIDKVTVVVDLGGVVNPDNVVAQVEGAVIMAIGAATKQGITYAQGKVE